MQINCYYLEYHQMLVAVVDKCSAFSTYWNVAQDSAFSTRVLNGQRKILPKVITNHHRAVSPLKI